MVMRGGEMMSVHCASIRTEVLDPRTHGKARQVFSPSATPALGRQKQDSEASQQTGLVECANSRYSRRSCFNK